MHSFPSPLIHSLDSGSNSSVFIFLYLYSYLYAPYFYIYQLKRVKLVILWTWKNRDTLAYCWSGQLLPSAHLPLLTSPLGSSIKCSWPDGYAFLDSFIVTCCHFFFQTSANLDCINSKKNNNDNIDDDYFPSCTYFPISSFCSSSLHFLAMAFLKTCPYIN